MPGENLHSQVKTSTKFVRILEQVKPPDALICSKFF